MQLKAEQILQKVMLLYRICIETQSDAIFNVKFSAVYKFHDFVN